MNQDEDGYVMSLHFAIIAAISILGSAQSSILDLSRIEGIAGESRCPYASRAATSRWQAERRIVIRHRAAPRVQILSFGP